MKYNTMRIGLVLLAAAFIITACSSPMLETPNTDQPQVALDEQGILAFSVFVPAYRQARTETGVSAKIIDPGTKYLRLLLNGTVHGADIPFGTPQETEEGLVWNTSVSVPVPLSGEFDSVRIHLLNLDKQILTAGEQRDVGVTKGTATPIAVGCFPVDVTHLVFDGDGQATSEGPASAGESVYFSFNVTRRTTYDLEADIGTADGDVDLFLFDSSGKQIAKGETIGEPLEPISYMTEMNDKFYVLAYPLSTSGSATFSVAETNQPPVADPGRDQLVETGVEVSFDGSGSYDPEGANLLHTWEIRDGGGTLMATRYGIIVTHTFASADTYTISLTVRDEGGATGTADAFAYITSANVAPVAAAGPDVTVKEASEVQFDGSASYDPNESDVLSYSWEITDEGGSTVDTLGGVDPTYVFATPGMYDVELTVTDDDPDALSDSNSLTITVLENRAPVAIMDGLPDIIAVGDSLDLDGLDSYDPDDDIADLAFAWEIHDSDGTLVTPAPDAGSTSSHVFDTPGEYTITLTVSDPLGAADTDSASVIVESMFKFDVQFEAGISVEWMRPVVVLIAEAEDLNGDASIDKNDFYLGVAHVYCTTPGSVMISTVDIPGYSTTKDYMLFAIHDVNDSFNPAVHITQILGDQQDFIGICVEDASVPNGLVYDVSSALELVKIGIVPDTVYSFVMEDQTGTIDLLVY